MTSHNTYRSSRLREKCPNTELFLVRIFLFTGAAFNSITRKKTPIRIEINSSHLRMSLFEKVILKKIGHKIPGGEASHGERWQFSVGEIFSNFQVVGEIPQSPH